MWMNVVVAFFLYPVVNAPSRSPFFIIVAVIAVVVMVVLILLPLPTFHASWSLQSICAIATGTPMHANTTKVARILSALVNC